MSNYYYLHIKLILQRPVEIFTAPYLKKNVLQAVKQLFGEIAAAVCIDVLKLNPETLEAVLRVPKSHYVKVKGSLVLSGLYEGQQCTYRLEKCSPLLLALQGDSREYKH
ncbi:hypothetical protein HUJ05_012532 [Dendroctonus ponderosae]|nr:hypothetical protein HUJ05_012532 [Dendroctonus ponderosae]